MHKPEEVVIVFLDNGRRQILNEQKILRISSMHWMCNCLLDCPLIMPWVPFGADGMLGGRGVALSSLLHGVREGIEMSLLCTPAPLRRGLPLEH